VAGCHDAHTHCCCRCSGFDVCHSSAQTLELRIQSHCRRLQRRDPFSHRCTKSPANVVGKTRVVFKPWPQASPPLRSVVSDVPSGELELAELC
jgi:hypothetical protein